MSYLSLSSSFGASIEHGFSCAIYAFDRPADLGFGISMATACASYAENMRGLARSFPGAYLGGVSLGGMLAMETAWQLHHGSRDGMMPVFGVFSLESSILMVSRLPRQSKTVALVARTG